MDDLDFITDVGLRKTVEDSIEYAYVLSEESKGKNRSALFQEETRRVVVLYTVSIIEAVLLYLYKKHGDEMTYIDYKYVNVLPPEYHYGKDDESRMVIAVQQKNKKAEYQIGVNELVKFFTERMLMKKETAEEILKINDLRNTFHLNKPREKAVCDISQVETALKLLVYVIQRAPKSVLKN
jgi:intergrase/recombinase